MAICNLPYDAEGDITARTVGTGFLLLFLDPKDADDFGRALQGKENPTPKKRSLGLSRQRAEYGYERRPFPVGDARNHSWGSLIL